MPASALGTSLSLHRCRELGVNPRGVLRAALKDLGCRQFRLMSYWNIHEPSRGVYDFRELDWQMDMVAEHGGTVSLCLGKRQPRWPECHMPDWTRPLSRHDWYEALYRYIEVVVLRYKGHPALASWQLENEALLKSFGYCPDGDYRRGRLRQEARLVRTLDSVHPLIMSLSDSWGIPCCRPKPDLYAMTIYRQVARPDGAVRRSNVPATFYWLRGHIIHLLTRRPVFIHELQAEPWVSTAILSMPVEEQLQLCDEATLRQNVAYAAGVGLGPTYLWGLEWWYWLKTKQRHAEVWEAAGGLFWDEAASEPRPSKRLQA